MYKGVARKANLGTQINPSKGTPGGFERMSGDWVSAWISLMPLAHLFAQIISLICRLNNDKERYYRNKRSR